MNIEKYKQKLLKDKEFRKECESYDLSFEISNIVLEARLIKGLTQSELAKRVGTKQESIARLENGQNLPSLSFLDKVAREGFHSYIVAPRFAFMVTAGKLILV